MTAVKVQSKSGAEKVRDLLKGKPARTGAQLVRALALSGTPDGKLGPARDLLRGSPRATAAEVIRTLEEAGSPAATLGKARKLAEDGTLPARRQARSVEEEILAEEEAEEKPAPKK